MNRISFPRRTYADFSNPITELIEVRRKMLPGHPFVFDLHNSEFLSPLLLCGSAAFAKRWTEDGHEVKVDIRANDPQMRNYLHSINYPDGFWNVDLSFEARRRLVTLQSRNHVPLIGFSATDKEDQTREQLIQALEDLLIKQCHMKGQVLMAMKYFLAELTGNIGYHAGRGSGFVMAQYNLEQECLDVAIADTGQGLLGSYTSSGFFKPANDVEALKLALSGQSTKYDGTSRGFGIPTSRRMLVHGMNGAFFLWSGDSCLFYTKQRETIYQFKDGTSYPGCYFALRIPTRPHVFNYYNFLDRG